MIIIKDYYFFQQFRKLQKKIENFTNFIIIIIL